MQNTTTLLIYIDLTLNMNGRRFHRTMEVIPTLPWKSKSPSVSRPSKLSIEQGEARGASEAQRRTSSIRFHCQVPSSRSGPRVNVSSPSEFPGNSGELQGIPEQNPNLADLGADFCPFCGIFPSHGISSVKRPLCNLPTTLTNSPRKSNGGATPSGMRHSFVFVIFSEQNIACLWGHRDVPPPKGTVCDWLSKAIR